MEVTGRAEIGALWRMARAQGLIDEDDTAVVFLNLAVIEDRVRRTRDAFPEDAFHAVAIKTNPLGAVLGWLGRLGTGLEAASFTELLMGRDAGLPPERLVLDSPAKTHAEIRRLMDEFPGLRVNVDSLDELRRYPRADTGLSLGIRVNPQIASASVSSMNVGGPDSKFGEPLAHRESIIEACRQWADVDCLHVHIGSQFSDFGPAVRSIAAVEELAREINRRAGEERIRWLDVGGGLPVNYHRDGAPCHVDAYAQALRRECPWLFDGTYRLITEYGRYIHANAGWAVTTIEYVKPAGNRVNLIVHTGADMFVRECYNPDDWYHEMFVMDADGKEKSGALVPSAIGGPLCFGGDFVRRDADLPAAQSGDLLVIEDIGANTFALWSRHCSRPFPKVISCYWPEENPEPADLAIARPRELPEEIIRFWQAAP